MSVGYAASIFVFFLFSQKIDIRFIHFDALKPRFELVSLSFADPNVISVSYLTETNDALSEESFAFRNVNVKNETQSGFRHESYLWSRWIK